MALPKGWTKDLTSAQVAAVRATERAYGRGRFRFLPTDHEDGYRRVWLPPGHPYAVAGGPYVAPDGAHFSTKRAARRAGWAALEVHRRPCFGGWCYLHRYLAQRQLGRRLSRFEHVHHREVAGELAPKSTEDVALLEVLEAAEHGRFHRNRWIGCGAHVHPCPNCGGHGCPPCQGAGAVAA